LDPSIEKIVYEGRSNNLYEHAFDWILEEEAYQLWRTDRQAPLLWVEDKTGKGHTTAILKILEHLQAREQASSCNEPLISYFFCRSFNETNKTASRVLEGLLYLLVFQNPSSFSNSRLEYGRALLNPSRDSVQFHILARVLADVLKDAFFKARQIYLVIDGIDLLMPDDDGSSGNIVLDRVIKLTSSHENIKWIVSSRDRCPEPRQHGSSMRVLTIGPERLACSLGLSNSVDMLHRHGAQMDALYHSYRSQCVPDLQPLDWFRYTKAGRAWLDRRPLLDAKQSSCPSMVWYRPELSDCSPDMPSQLGLFASGLVNRSVSRSKACMHGYFSFRCLRGLSNSSTSAAHPSLVLWCLIAHLIFKYYTGSSRLCELIVDLSTETQKVLRDIYLKLVSSDQESKPKPASFDPKSSCGDLGESLGYIELLGTTFFDDSYVQPLNELLQKLAAASPSDPFLLVVDFFEIAQRARWLPLFQMLLSISSDGTSQILLSGGRIGHGDNPQSDAHTDFDLKPICESTEYRGQSYWGGRTVGSGTYNNFRMFAETGVRRDSFAPGPSCKRSTGDESMALEQ